MRVCYGSNCQVKDMWHVTRGGTEPVSETGGKTVTTGILSVPYRRYGIWRPFIVSTVSVHIQIQVQVLV